MNTLTVQTVTEQGLQQLAVAGEHLAEIEGLHAHQYALQCRRLAIELANQKQ